MRSESNVNWSLLLDKDSNVSASFEMWSVGNMSTRELTDTLSHTRYAGEFRHLVRSRGTTEARKLARKALRYRGSLV